MRIRILLLVLPVALGVGLLRTAAYSQAPVLVKNQQPLSPCLTGLEKSLRVCAHKPQAEQPACDKAADTEYMACRKAEGVQGRGASRTLPNVGPS
jgi:hypothetical protein